MSMQLRLAWLAGCTLDHKCIVQADGLEYPSDALPHLTDCLVPGLCAQLVCHTPWLHLRCTFLGEAM